LDLNNDGIAHNDIYEELMSLEANKPINDNGEYTALVSLFGSDNGTITFCLPMQGILYHWWNDTFDTETMYGGRFIFTMHFSFDSEGKLSTEYLDSSNTDMYQTNAEYGYLHDGMALFNMDGTMTFSASYSLYDKKTDRLIEGVIHYGFRKKQ